MREMPPHAWARMEGLGNDFLVTLAPADQPLPAPESVRAWCDRRLGIGGDGVLWLTREFGDNWAMQVLNADGSIAEMCGNGLRCAASYLAGRGLLSRGERHRVRTGAGILEVRVLDGGLVTTTLGVPSLAPVDLPALVEHALTRTASPQGLTEIVPWAGAPRMALVSMGNPHAVVVEPEWSAEAFRQTGHRLQTHPVFPRGVNLGWIRDRRDEVLDLMVWERGVGPTEACGTGAAAAAVVAGHRFGRGGSWTVRQPGGTLGITREHPDAPVEQTGPARLIALGTWPDLARPE